MDPSLLTLAVAGEDGNEVPPPTGPQRPWDQKKAAEHFSALWFTRCTIRDLEEEALLGQTNNMHEGKVTAFPIPKYWRLLNLVALHTGLTLFMLFTAVLTGLTVITVIVTASLYVDDLVTPTAGGKPGMVNDSHIITMFLASVIMGTCIALRKYFVETSASTLMVDIQMDIIAAFQNKPMEWFDVRATSQLVELMTQDIPTFASKFFKAHAQCSWSVVQVACGLATIGMLSPEAMGYTILVVPFVFLGQLVDTFVSSSAQQAAAVQSDRTSIETKELVTKLRTIRACGMEEKEARDIRESVEATVALQLKLAQSHGLYQFVRVVSSAGSLCFLLFVQGKMLERHDMSVGGILGCLLAFVYVLVHTADFFSNAKLVPEGMKASGHMADVLGWSLTQREAAAAQREAEKLGTVPGAPTHQGAPFSGLNADFRDERKGRLTFEEVTFTYPQRPGYRILNYFTMTIQPRQILGLMGATGSGKSSLLKLVMRWYRCDSGAISIDGVNVLDFNHSYTSQVGYIGSESTIFTGTVKHNITYGCIDQSGEKVITDTEMIQAARLADAHRFIMKLPLGYDTVIGEGAHRLSPSQVQRIAVARMFARSPPIVVLDEASSPTTMGTDGADRVRIALRRLLSFPTKRTAIVASQHHQDLEYADVVAMVEGGMLTEYGSRAEMMSNTSTGYYKLLLNEGIYKKPESVISGASTPNLESPSGNGSEVAQQNEYKHPYAVGKSNKVHPHTMSTNFV